MIYGDIICRNFNNRPEIGQPIFATSSNGSNLFPNHFVPNNSALFSIKSIFCQKTWFLRFLTWTGSNMKSTFPCMIPLRLACIQNLLIFRFLSIYALLRIFPAQKKLWGVEVRKMTRYSPLDDSITFITAISVRSAILPRSSQIITTHYFFKKSYNS